MSANDIEIEFHKENDILHVLKKKTNLKKVVNVEVRAGMVFRIHVDTKEVVGLVLHHVSHKAPRLLLLSNYELMEEFEDRLKLLNDYHEAEQRV